MKGRHAAAGLCVLLMHALIIFLLLSLRTPGERRSAIEQPETEPIHIYLQPVPSVPMPAERPITAQPAPARKPPAKLAESEAAPPAPESSAITPPGDVDWPEEGKKSVARVLAAEAEAERVARMFSGPQGTWASLTPRERSRLKKFKWKPGVEPPKVDANGNTVVQLNEHCVLVNFAFIGCSIGKIPAYGDLFKDMREYFDEQRLPQTRDGNGK